MNSVNWGTDRREKLCFAPPTFPSVSESPWQGHFSSNPSEPMESQRAAEVVQRLLVLHPGLCDSQTFKKLTQNRHESNFMAVLPDTIAQLLLECELAESASGLKSRLFVDDVDGSAVQSLPVSIGFLFRPLLEEATLGTFIASPSNLPH